jgi:hypothetical protein
VAVIRLLVSGLMLVAASLCSLVQAADLPLLQSSDFDPARDRVVSPDSTEVKAGEADIHLSMDFTNLFATADGPRMEGSDSMIGKLVVPEPRSVSLPEMQVTLVGHVIKTAPSVARLDLQIGDTKRSFVWTSDEVKSGRFELTFSEPMPRGMVPATLPVSVIALVTKESRTSVVMVSLESMKVTISSARVADGKLQPESTALWPDLQP